MIQLTDDFQLSGLTTFHIPAKCRRLVTYTDARTDLPELFAAGCFEGQWLHIGEGANLLFTADYEGTVVRSADKVFNIAPVDGSSTDFMLIANCGSTLDSLIEKACERGLWGLENLSGIPGCIGGTVVQNVGAYGAELKDCIDSVTLFDVTTGEFRAIGADACDFGYRRSMFKLPENKRRFIVVQAKFRLSVKASPRLGYGKLCEAVDAMRGNRELTPSMVRQAVIATRDSKLPNPAVTGSAGSFFKNPVISEEDYRAIVDVARSLWGDGIEVPCYDLPDGMVKVPAAWFIDRCGWKGVRQGGAGVWENQPLVLVNLTGHATAEDVLTLQQRIVDDIYSKFAVELHPEVEFV